jgi:hypothetical protein
MWLPDESKAVLVRFHALHPKPTYGDVIVVERALPDGILTWDSFGLSSARVKKRLEEDGGRYMVVLEYVPDPPGHDARAAYRALSLAGDHLDIVVEGCFPPEHGRPGLACLAVPYQLNPLETMKRLRARRLPLKLKVVAFDSAHIR